MTLTLPRLYWRGFFYALSREAPNMAAILVRQRTKPVRSTPSNHLACPVSGLGRLRRNVNPCPITSPATMETASDAKVMVGR
jgi:hypothetical protein